MRIRMALIAGLFLLIICFGCKTGQAQLSVGDRCSVGPHGRPGICKIKCPLAERNAQNGISPTICGFFHEATPIPCCELESVQPNTFTFSNPDSIVYPEDEDPEPPPRRPTINTNFNDGLRLCELKCEEYINLTSKKVSAALLSAFSTVVSEPVPDCDNSNPLIVGGQPAGPKEFPYMAALGYNSDSGNDIEWNCGATLISDFFLVTAAHCLPSENLPVVVRLGELDLTDPNDYSQPQNFQIANIIKHPQYIPPKKYFDIGLVRLASRVQFNDFIKPACLHAKKGFGGGRKAIATGWGKTRESDRSSKLLKVVLNIYENEVCREKFKPDKKIPQGIVDSMLCAGDMNKDRDSCTGDSGGPLVIKLDEKKCQFYLIGVTSFGKLCGYGNPGIYTRILSFIPWIEQNVW